MKKIIFIFLFIINGSIANAQLILRFAEYQYKALNYPDAIPYFKYYANRKDTNDIVVLRKLADCYRLTNQYVEAEKIYAKLIKKDTLLQDLLYYEDARLRIQKNIVKYDTLNIKVKRLAFNSDYSDFAPSIYHNKLIFASSIQVKPFIQRNHTWTETNFLSLQESSTNDDFFSYKPFALELRNKYNFGPATFLEQDSMMYYTTNNPKIKSKNGYINLRIQSAAFIYGKWRNVDKFNFNSDDYACAHPSVAKDGSKLFFSSNMPGGYGGMDIYVCNWLNDSAWSTPINLGPIINTKEEEVFPFIFNDNLYFASNGRDGFGGLDIYSFDFNKLNNGVNTFPYPINSTDDDFGLILHPSENAGFFSSDRGKKGIDDDIYSFEIIAKNIKILVIDSLTNKYITSASVKIINKNTSTIYNTDLPIFIRTTDNDFFVFDVNAENYNHKIITQKFSLTDSVFIIPLSKNKKACHLQGHITFNNSNTPIPDVQVKIYNFNKNTLVFNSKSNAQGFYKMYNLESNTRYAISFTKNGFFTKELLFATTDEHCILNTNADYNYIKDVALDSIILGKAIKIDNIYFDLAKWNIRKDAAIELDKIVKLLQENPDIIIELSSHTDSRASAKYNEALSDKRAKSSVAYIVSKGIDQLRITGKGYGEYMLINNCADGIKCSEYDHQQNRRTEFKVIGFK